MDDHSPRIAGQSIRERRTTEPVVKALFMTATAAITRRAGIPSFRPPPSTHLTDLRQTNPENCPHGSGEIAGERPGNTIAEYQGRQRIAISCSRIKEEKIDLAKAGIELIGRRSNQ
ncbi:hypothetical protein ACQPYK_45355 [Streptosporangium sp. CA-135522]|uniref:hypothetical protein n=1 Tax=Streptosporangium sp. CA-135522 TaxID=3240072 RepID=UPI003D8CF542